jgi:Chaperone of endosialidase
MKPSIERRKSTPLFAIAILLSGFWLLPLAQAVVPAPDGGYPGGNTAEGQTALFSLTTGGFNTAVGYFALRSDTTGQFNTAVGAGTLLADAADRNTAIGAGALLANSGGHDNTGTGVFALLNNTTGHENTAHGGGALFHNVGGSSNTAIGVNALFANMNNGGNTAVGGAALYNTISDSNTAVGLNALFTNTTGSGNIGIGVASLISNSIGSNNTALGGEAGSAVTGDSNICIGAGVIGTPGESNTIRIGDNLPGAPGLSGCYVGGIYGQGFVSMNYLQVGIDDTGKLGTLNSSRRFKKDIQAMENTSEAILALKPVTFRYKSDAKNTPCFGLIAEEVAEVNPTLVVRDHEGKPYSVRYDQVNAMLLNEFLKEHKKVEEQHATIVQLKSNAAKQEATINELTKDIGVLTVQFKEQAAQIQRMNAQVEMNDLPPHVVAKR